MLRSNSKSLGNHVVSFGEKKSGKGLQKRKVGVIRIRVKQVGKPN